MTLLGTAPTFSLGSSTPGGGDASMGKSLDEIIQDRRKQQQQESKRGPKKPSAVDRSIGAGRAKRDAAVKARRGLAQTAKPTKMDVEKEVERQTQKTANEKKKKEKKATQGRMAPESAGRSKKKKAKAGKKDPPPAIFGGRAPPKKAIEAAIQGMEAAGFKVPEGHTMVMTFVPIAITPSVTPKDQPNRPDFSKGNSGGRGGGGPKGNSGGRGGGPKGRNGGGRGEGGGRNRK